MSEVTAKPRKAIAAVLKKKLQQEANSMCPFCGNSEPGTWEFHLLFHQIHKTCVKSNAVLNAPKTSRMFRKCK